MCGLKVSIKGDLPEKAGAVIKEYNLIEKNDSIVVGVSGGPDSMTLLSILLKLKEEFNLKIYVAHVNHMLRENAIKDEEYVKEFCEKNNIEIFIKKANISEIAQKEKIGLEEAGRNVRYNFFEEVLKNTESNKIAIAHNLNDKVETIIMNTLRGSGVSGLKGIEAKRKKYIRPLNDENTYTRNKIRNIVIPYRKNEFNPNIIKTLNRLSEIIKEEDEYVQSETEKIFKEILLTDEKNKIEFDPRKFNEQEKVIQKNLILLAIKKVKGSTQGIEKVNIDDIIKLCNNNIGNKLIRPTKQLEIGIKNKRIYIKNII